MNRIHKTKLLSVILGMIFIGRTDAAAGSNPYLPLMPGYKYIKDLSEMVAEQRNTIAELTKENKALQLVNEEKDKIIAEQNKIIERLMQDLEVAREEKDLAIALSGDNTKRQAEIVAKYEEEKKRAAKKIEKLQKGTYVAERAVEDALYALQLARGVSSNPGYEDSEGSKAPTELGGND